MSIVLSQLQKRIADQNPGLIRADINKSIQIILSEIIEALCNGKFDAVELRGFGRFSLKLQKAGIRRNPATNSEIYVQQKLKLKYKASKTLLNRLNNISDNY